MAWTETDPMKERLHFVTDWDRRLYTVTELCARYGVSRKTGYKWLARYADVGVAGLAERSRAPHRCPHRIAPAVAAAIVETRRQHPSWGPRKLLVWLADHRSGLELPAASTAGDLLHRRGLVRRRRRRRAWKHPGAPELVTAGPNDVWTADFKGHFRTGDGAYCHPLTVPAPAAASSAASSASALSTTTSGRMKHSASSRRLPSGTRRRARTRAAWRTPSTPAITWCASSRMQARSASKRSSSSSRRP